MTKEFDPKVYLQQGAWRDVRLGLHRTEELLERLGRPQDRLRIVHVAGTNGKGSTCAFTAGILQAAGYKVGLFTSPYVLRFNERIQVNREDISDEDLLAVALEVREAAEQMDEQPTAFELITAVALLHFAQVGCTAVVLEVGLGGRLDSTNVVVPEVCAITSIALDHTHVLGDTIAKIAHEKAGIIKAGIPVVSYKQKPEAEAVIMRRAREVGAGERAALRSHSCACGRSASGVFLRRLHRCAPEACGHLPAEQCRDGHRNCPRAARTWV